MHLNDFLFETFLVIFVFPSLVILYLKKGLYINLIILNFGNFFIAQGRICLDRDDVTRKECAQ